MKKGLLFLLILPGMLTYGQSDSSNESNTERYLEDQFYLGITYNFLGNTPEGLSQQNFSYGLQLGVIKDIPLNRAGTKAIGIGLGVALDTYYTNLIGIDNVSGITYSLSDGVEGFKRSKIETHLIELPLSLDGEHPPQPITIFGVFTQALNLVTCLCIPPNIMAIWVL